MQLGRRHIGKNRVFGVIQRKFQILVHLMEHWYVKDIKEIVEACVILHNMMVKMSMDRGKAEGSTWYKYWSQFTRSQTSIGYRFIVSSSMPIIELVLGTVC